MKKIIKWIVIGVGILIVLGIIIGSSAPKTEEVEQVVESNETEKEKIIPGITTADLTINLKNKGFDCKDMEISDDGMASWWCEETTLDHYFVVELLGNSPTKIQSIQTTALNYSVKDTNEVTKDFLGYIASIPYEGANQAGAKDWVKQNIGENTKKVIGNIKFTLSSNARARMLTIEHKDLLYKGKEVQPTSKPTLTSKPTSKPKPTLKPKPQPTLKSTLTPTDIPTPVPTPTQTPTPIFKPTATSKPMPTEMPILKYVCDCSKTCSQMIDCNEAYFQLNDCGCTKRDNDKDGIPCESICH